MKLVLLSLSVMALTASSALAQPPRPPLHGGLQGFALLASDANADGKITRAELEGFLSARFGRIDTDKDGFVSPEERRSARDSDLAARRAEVDKERFAGLDKDGNGQLSPSEFALPPAARSGPLEGVRERREHAHGRGDLNANRHAGRAWGAAYKERRAGRPTGSDPGDQIGRVQFSAAAIDAFTRADANKDGIVTIGELQAGGRGRP